MKQKTYTNTEALKIAGLSRVRLWQLMNPQAKKLQGETVEVPAEIPEGKYWVWCRGKIVWLNEGVKYLEKRAKTKKSRVKKIVGK